MSSSSASSPSTLVRIRSRYVVISLVLVASAAGCGKAHLGPAQGRRYHEALRAQAARSSESPDDGFGADAHDARRTLSRQRAQTAPTIGGPGGVGSGVSPATSGLLGGGAGGGAGIGASNNPNPIRLEAK